MIYTVKVLTDRYIIFYLKTLLKKNQKVHEFKYIIIINSVLYF